MYHNKEATVNDLEMLIQNKLENFALMIKANDVKEKDL